MKKIIISLFLTIIAFGIKAQHLTPPSLRTSKSVATVPKPPIYQGKTVIYHLFVKDTVVNFTGKYKRAIAVNGQIPMPTLTFTEGGYGRNLCA